VLIFEMVAGCPPFYHEDRVTMFKNICHVKYSMPAHFSRVSCRKSRCCATMSPMLPKDGSASCGGQGLAVAARPQCKRLSAWA